MRKYKKLEQASMTGTYKNKLVPVPQALIPRAPSNGYPIVTQNHGSCSSVTLAILKKLILLSLISWTWQPFASFSIWLWTDFILLCVHVCACVCECGCVPRWKSCGNQRTSGGNANFLPGDRISQLLLSISVKLPYELLAPQPLITSSL